LELDHSHAGLSNGVARGRWMVLAADEGTAVQRTAVLGLFARSGLSGPAFARVAGIAYPTFAN